MDTAQDLVAQTIGILLLAWVLGYTLIRAHEAGFIERRNEASPSDVEDAPRRRTLADAASRWREGSLTAPLWGAVAGVASGFNWGRRKVNDFRHRERGNDPDPSREREPDEPHRDEPDHGGEGDRENRRRERRRWGWDGRRHNRDGQDTDDGERREHGEGDDRHDHGEGERETWHGDDPEPDPGPWDDYRYQGDEGRRDPFRHDIEVEVVGTRPTTPGPTALDRPIHILTARPEHAADVPAAGTLPHPGEDSPDERIPMGQHIAIPGATAPAARIVGALASTGDTHQDAMAFSRKIEQAVDMTADTITRAEAQIVVSLRAAWVAVDALANAGISGPVMDNWANAVLALEAARGTAAQLVRDAAEANAAVATAKRTQGRMGDPIHDAVAAAGNSVASSTRYYGNRR
ncbi:hypothetical protein Aph01nite_08390 [Acrocarpospora phusangensis]|uniref:Uncharacterized protein n=1 Tax=Acrocarpospora phusangensis TaxID=1070424 RepID=A0A919Q535_9ACTN|nr:hypothetical protein [Acrocarpospora phusangensis]GIH22529.1 hypothetical protein Aph01nite_08390 [Acrocarpospora phusangensis]